MLSSGSWVIVLLDTVQHSAASHVNNRHQGHSNSLNYFLHFLNSKEFYILGFLSHTINCLWSKAIPTMFFPAPETTFYWFVHTYDCSTLLLWRNQSCNRTQQTRCLICNIIFYILYKYNYITDFLFYFILCLRYWRPFDDGLIAGSCP